MSEKESWPEFVRGELFCAQNPLVFQLLKESELMLRRPLDHASGRLSFMHTHGIDAHPSLAALDRRVRGFPFLIGIFRTLEQQFAENEIPDASCPLYDAPNVIMTPHIGASTRENMLRIGDVVVRILEDFVDRTAES